MDLSPSDPARRAALDYLLSRVDHERAVVVPYDQTAFKLARTRDLLDRLGGPDAGLPLVHLAGTKGKGSTAAMLAAAATAAGYRTGLFTSPHLERLEERFRVDGEPCSAAELVALVDRLRPVVRSMDEAAAAHDPPEYGPTYFELTTALALLHFRARDAALGVLEVGLGGRLDSTNVCRPRVSVITTISFDHTRQLGPTLAAIAREKAGIIKPGVPVISGVLPDEPRAVIHEVAARVGAPVRQLGRDFDFAYEPPRHLEQGPALGRLDFRWLTDSARRDRLGMGLALPGRHQALNAAVALAALGELEAQGWRFPDEAVARALAALDWPGRMEIVSRRPTVILDTAHNVASVEALVATLDESFAARRRLLLLGTSRDKDLPGMLARLLPKFDAAMLTRYTHNPRSVPAAELATIAAELGYPRTEFTEDPHEAWRRVRAAAGPDDLICVTGSFFLAGELGPVVRGETS